MREALDRSAVRPPELREEAGAFRLARDSSRTGRALHLLFILLALAGPAFTGCTTSRIIWHNYAGLEDYKIFPSRPVRPAAEPSPFRRPSPEAAEAVRALIRGNAGGTDQDTLAALLGRSSVVAFLALREDTLLYEKYLEGYDAGSIVPSFSVAKSFVSALVGAALAEGRIASVEQPVTDFLPELAPRGFGAVRIRHCLQMTSGIKFNENYGNPFSDVAYLYYGSNLRKSMARLTLECPPGTRFKYQSANTELLGLILERATGMPLSDYLEQAIWQPLGMEYEASWSLDRRENGMERAFCCLNARARDYARFGLLYLNRGMWQGRRVLPESWCGDSTRPSEDAGGSWEYGYQWWRVSREGTDYYAQGLLGQFIYVSPAHRMVMVLLSKKEAELGPEFLRSLAGTLDLALREGRKAE